MSDKFSPRVRIYQLSDGEPLEPLLDYPLDQFGSCPNVGDTLCFDMPSDKFFSVSRRYYIKFEGWAVIVREVQASSQTNAVLTAWKADDEWDAEIEAEEAIEDQKENQRKLEHMNLLLGVTPKEIALNQREETAI